MGHEEMSGVAPIPSSEAVGNGTQETERNLSEEIEKAEAGLREQTDALRANLEAVQEQKKTPNFGELRDIRKKYIIIANALGASSIVSMLTMLPTVIAAGVYANTDLAHVLEKANIVSFEQMTGGFARGPFDGFIGNTLAVQGGVAVSLILMAIGAKIVEGMKLQKAAAQ